MRNVVEFPAADRPFTESEIAKLHSKAFRDLEDQISDCEIMAKIAPTLEAMTMNWSLRFSTSRRC
jgi:hypothetical protein